MFVNCKNTLFAVGLFACGPQQQPATGVQAANSAAPSANSTVADDPLTCVDPAHRAESEWRTNVGRKLNEKLPSLERCVSAGNVTREARFWVHTRFTPSGAWHSLESAVTTLPDCRAIECIGEAFSAVTVEPWKGEKVPTVSLEFFLSPNARPRQSSAVDGPFPFKDAKRCGEVSESSARGRLPPELIQKIVRTNYPAFKACYEEGLGRNRNLRGRVMVRFVIERDGRVGKVSISENMIPDCKVVHCVRDGFSKLEFPPPEGGIVTVVYPIMLEPG